MGGPILCQGEGTYGDRRKDPEQEVGNDDSGEKVTKGEHIQQVV